jgi:hypothetical protein
MPENTVYWCRFTVCPCEMNFWSTIPSVLKNSAFTIYFLQWNSYHFLSSKTKYLIFDHHFLSEIEFFFQIFHSPEKKDKNCR